MSRLPAVKPKEMLQALLRSGFVIERIKGSHHFLIHKDDPRRRTVIAIHSAILRRAHCVTFSSRLVYLVTNS